MVVAAVLGRGLSNAALAIVVVAWPVVRAGRARARALGRRIRVRAVGAAARRVEPQDAVPRHPPERRRPDLRARDARPRERDPAARRASRSSASARSRRRRSGGRWSRTGRSTSSGGGSAPSRGSRSSPSCSRSTSSATRCATCSTREPRGASRCTVPLAVEGLRVRLPTPAGDVTVVDGVDYEVQPAEVFGIAGESGSGKTVSMLALLGLLPEGSTVEGSARFGDDDLIAHLRGAACRASAGATSRWSSRTRTRRCIRCSRWASSSPSTCACIWGSTAGGRRARGRAARRRSHPRPARGAAEVPAPVLGRHAAAHRDRDRPRLPAAPADRRRADDRARRDGAGRDPAPARPASPRARARGRADHSRPRRPLVDRRPRLDLLRGARGRVRCARRRAAAAAPPVHARAARRASPSGGAEGAGSRRDRRRAADAGSDPSRLCVPPALRVCYRGVPDGRAAARARRGPAARLSCRPVRRHERARAARRRRRLPRPRRQRARGRGSEPLGRARPDRRSRRRVGLREVDARARGGRPRQDDETAPSRSKAGP